MTQSNIQGRLLDFLHKFGLITLCACGVYIRFREYLFNRSLWLDEATLALNIVNKSFSQLMTMPLENATAPLGFVLLSKMVTMAGGDSEYALRFIPLCAGVVSLILFIQFLRQYGDRRAIPPALILFSLSYALLRYSTEFKPYSSDVLIALLILWGGISTLSRKFDFRYALRWGVGGGMLLWFSFPSVFVLGAVGMALFGRFASAQSWKELRNLGVALALWFLSFYMFYSFSVRHIASNSSLENYWVKNFMPFPLDTFDDLLWVGESFAAMLAYSVYPGGIQPVFLGLIAFVAGSYAVFRKKWDVFLMLLMPLVLALAASAMHRYPFSDRFLLFYVPVICFLISEGLMFLILRRPSKAFRPGLVERLIKKTSFIPRIWGYVSVAVIIFFPLMMVPVYLSSRVVYAEEIKPVLRHVQNNSKKEDVLYVYYGAEPAFNYYRKVYGLTENHSYVQGISSRENWKKYKEDVSQFKNRARVWIIFAHVYYDAGGKGEESYIVGYLESIGTQIDVVMAEGASAYLFDLANDPQR